MTVLAKRLTIATDPGPLALAALVLCALSVAVGGYFHGKLLHQGYGDVPVVGPLFFLNVLGSASVVCLLLARRVALFLGGALSISAGAVVSIYISHTSSFFGFAEQGYSSAAKVIVIAELAAVVFALLAAGLERERLLPAAPARVTGTGW